MDECARQSLQGGEPAAGRSFSWEALVGAGAIGYFTRRVLRAGQGIIRDRFSRHDYGADAREAHLP